MKCRAVAFALVLSLLAAACSQDADKKETGGKDQKEAEGLQVLCSFLPLWAFTRNVVGDRQGVEVDVLIPGEQGPHDYQLTPADMKKINAADLLVANGYQLDEFITDAAREARPDLRILKAAEVAEPIYIEEAGHIKNTGKEKGHGHDHHAVNPHVFASPKHAAMMVREIGKALSKVDPAGREVYHRNAELYAVKLEKIGEKIKELVDESSNPKIVTFHNAFDYLAQASGLEIVGSIEVVPGQQPSAGELSGLAEKIRRTGAVAVFAEPQYSPRLARVLAREADVKMDYLDPAGTGEMRPGYYVEVMIKNYKTLDQVLPEKE
ncbi:MAG: metal ABC transporter substrate-binding protein [bacterium]